MTARQEAIRKQFAELDEAKADARKAEAEYKEQLNDAKHEAARIREEAREQGAQIVAGRARQGAGRGRPDHRARRTPSSRPTARPRWHSLRRDVGSLATNLAGRIVGESLDDDERQGRVVERFLADLEEAALMDLAAEPPPSALGRCSTERLDAATGDQPRPRAQLGDELFTRRPAVPRPRPACAASPPTARCPSRPSRAWSSTVFDGRVGEAALELLTDAVGRRWTLSRDLADVLERARARSPSCGPPAPRRGQVDATSCSSSAGIIDANPRAARRALRPGPLGRRQGRADRLAARRQGRSPRPSPWPSSRLAGTYRTMTGALAHLPRGRRADQGEAVATVRVARR